MLIEQEDVIKRFFSLWVSSFIRRRWMFTVSFLFMSAVALCVRRLSINNPSWLMIVRPAMKVCPHVDVHLSLNIELDFSCVWRLILSWSSASKDHVQDLFATLNFLMLQFSHLSHLMDSESAFVQTRAQWSKLFAKTENFVQVNTRLPDIWRNLLYLRSMTRYSV